MDRHVQLASAYSLEVWNRILGILMVTLGLLRQYSQFPIACECWENFKNTFFVQHLWTASSKKYILLDIAIISFKKILKIIENVHIKIGNEQ